MTFSTTAKARLEGMLGVAFLVLVAYVALRSISVARKWADTDSSKRPAPAVVVRATSVFNPPQVRRVWAPPYIDSDGDLRTGEYIYDLTPAKRSGEV